MNSRNLTRASLHPNQFGVMSMVQPLPNEALRLCLPGSEVAAVPSSAAGGSSPAAVQPILSTWQKTKGPNRTTLLSGFSASYTNLVRISVAPLSLVPAIRGGAGNLYRDIPLYDFRSMNEVYEQSLWQPRLSVALIGSFPLLARPHSAAGVFALVSYAVAQRDHELELRLMVSATRGNILSLVLGDGLRLAALGLLIGLAWALVLSRFLSSQLYEVRPYGPQTPVAISGLILVVAISACLLPAWRASRLDPTATFRME